MDSDPAPRYAQVAVLAHLGRAGGLFTYGLPSALLPLAGPGSLVRVPFAQRQLQGIVCSIAESTDLPRVREVEELLDPVPVVTAYQLRLAHWIAHYYSAPLSDVLGSMIPPGLGRKTVYVLETSATVGGERLSGEQRRVLDRVRDGGRVLLDDVQRDLPDIAVQTVVSTLVRRGILSRLAELEPPRVTARLQKIVSLTDEGLAALQDEGSLRRAPRQLLLMHEIQSRGQTSSADLARIQPGATAQLRALERKGWVRVEVCEARRLPLKMRRFERTLPRALSTAQAQAFRRIVTSIRSGRADAYLLHGVTGSGKTEVYLQAAAEAIRQGRQIIIMVPEISLTPQAVERVEGRFPGRVAVLHSKLSASERVDEWQRIRHGEVDVVVGPRSALFAPLPRPGLIVVDEEHEASYKQDASPRYHARETAVVLGRMVGATVVLGSATPDVVTYQAAREGRLTLLELPDRPVWNGDDGVDSAPVRPMPSVEIVDLRQELKLGNRGMFSSALLQAINQTLSDGYQALLFLNRRGTATVVLCRDCGYVVRCPNCDIPFTYHASALRLVCHRCNTRRRSPQTCPECGSHRIRYLGAGTQRVEEEVSKLFPAARVVRWDRDVTGGKEAHDRILQQFGRHEADILVGTQMIAKGLDFPLVTLVGVISADTGLHMPDFRSPERSFQLLTQVAGRAGRADIHDGQRIPASRVIVQTYTPEHYAIQAAKNHDYHRFFQDEITFRQTALYPPFARLVRFVYAAEEEEQCRRSADNLRAILHRAIDEEGITGAEVIGPAPCFVARARNHYYWQLIVRGYGPNHGQALRPLLDYVPPGWSIDVDPVDLL